MFLFQTGGRGFILFMLILQDVRLQIAPVVWYLLMTWSAIELVRQDSPLHTYTFVLLVTSPLHTYTFVLLVAYNVERDLDRMCLDRTKCHHSCSIVRCITYCIYNLLHIVLVYIWDPKVSNKQTNFYGYWMSCFLTNLLFKTTNFDKLYRQMTVKKGVISHQPFFHNSCLSWSYLGKYQMG